MVAPSHVEGREDGVNVGAIDGLSRSASRGLSHEFTSASHITYYSPTCQGNSDEKMYTEFRNDGWPLCPRCGEDELFTLALWPDWQVSTPPLAWCVARIDGCYRCAWAPHA